MYRLITVIVAMALHQIATASVVYGLLKVPRIRRRSCGCILSMLLLLVSPNSSPSSSFYDLNLHLAGHCLYLSDNNNSIQRDLTHSHWSGDAHIERSKGRVLRATERDRAIRCGIPACLAHATIVWRRAVGRPPE